MSDKFNKLGIDLINQLDVLLQYPIGAGTSNEAMVRLRTGFETLKVFIETLEVANRLPKPPEPNEVVEMADALRKAQSRNAWLESVAKEAVVLGEIRLASGSIYVGESTEIRSSHDNHNLLSFLAQETMAEDV